jgi:rare lipoprotein A
MSKSAAYSHTLICFFLASVLVGCSSVHDNLSLKNRKLTDMNGRIEQGSGDLIPQMEPPSKSGNPDNYVVFGRRYWVKETSAGYREQGIASWYGGDFHGRKTSSGPPYNMFAMTAAHKGLPIPTYVRVTNLENGRSVVVKVNDRGPFIDSRIIDLSYAAANRLDMLGQGTAKVDIVALEPYQFLPELAAHRAEVLQHMVSRQIQQKPNMENVSIHFAHHGLLQSHIVTSKNAINGSAILKRPYMHVIQNDNRNTLANINIINKSIPAVKNLTEIKLATSKTKHNISKFTSDPRSLVEPMKSKANLQLVVAAMRSKLTLPLEKPLNQQLINKSVKSKGGYLIESSSVRLTSSTRSLIRNRMSRGNVWIEPSVPMRNSKYATQHNEQKSAHHRLEVPEKCRETQVSSCTPVNKPVEVRLASSVKTNRTHVATD